MGKAINIGIDVGNYDTKTQNTTTPSGFAVFSKAPYGVTEVLEYDGKCYVPDIERFSYVKDKTVNDNCFILSLFGIAKEILATVKRNTDKEHIAEEIKKIEKVNLGVGLPPTHMATLAQKTLDYYKNHMKGEVRFNFCGYDYCFTLGMIRVYPQDFSALMTYHSKKDDFITNKFPSYYGIDIGGYTVDVVPIIKGMPQAKRCESLELGVLKLYTEIISTVERECGISLNIERIESVLRKEPTIIPQSSIQIIEDSAREWLDTMMNRLRQAGLSFDTYPVVFIGGGALLFKKFIKENALITTYDFIPSPRSNAEGYKTLLVAEIKKMQGR